MTETETATVCIVNIGPRERRKRLRFGVAALVLGAAIATMMSGFDIPRLWRLALFVPFWVGALGVFQARAKT